MFEEKTKTKIGLICMAVGMFCYIFKVFYPAFDLNGAVNFILTIAGALIGTHWATDMLSLKSGVQDNKYVSGVGELASQNDNKGLPK